MGWSKRPHFITIIFNIMANHPSALKRVRSNEKKREKNRYQYKTTRTFIKKLKTTKEQETASKELPLGIAMIDKLLKRGIIHKNKASRMKSRLARQVKKIAPQRNSLSIPL